MTTRAGGWPRISTKTLRCSRRPRLPETAHALLRYKVKCCCTPIRSRRTCIDLFAQATSASAARRCARPACWVRRFEFGGRPTTSWRTIRPKTCTPDAAWATSSPHRLNGTRRQHGATLFLDPATLEPFDDQWAYLSSIARLSVNEVAALARKLPDPKIGHDVRRLQLPTSSKIVPRPAAIIRASLGARSGADRHGRPAITGSQARHMDPEPGVPGRFVEPSPAISSSRRDEDTILPRGLLSLLTTLVESAGSTMRIDDCRVARD